MFDWVLNTPLRYGIPKWPKRLTFSLRRGEEVDKIFWQATNKLQKKWWQKQNPSWVPFRKLFSEFYMYLFKKIFFMVELDILISSKV